MSLSKSEKQKLLSSIEKYFISYRIPYEKSLNTRKKLNKILWIEDNIPTSLVLSFSVIPIIPTLIYGGMKYYSQKLPLAVKDLGFLHVWLICIFVAAVLSFLSRKFFLLLKKPFETKILDSKIEKFCLLSEAIHEFYAFKVNGNKSQYESAKNRLTDYINDGSENRIFIHEYDIVRGKGTYHSITISGEAWDIIGFLKACIEWINFTPETIRISEGLKKYTHQTPEYLREDEAVDEIFEASKYLQIYSFLNIAKRDDVLKLLDLNENDINEKVEQLKIDALKSFTEQLSSLKWDKERNWYTPPEPDRLKKVRRSINKFLLEQENYAYLMLIWTVLLFVTMGIVILLFLKLTPLTFDTKVLIGYISASFAGGIAIASNINKKIK